MKIYHQILLLILIPISLFSQNDNKTKSVLFVENEYFHDLQEEKFFLHTNKTTYFSGESIWWKAYVVSDFTNKPSNNTANLYVNFYDVNKKLISNQLFYCENGKANGEIILPSTLKTGEYYINLDTQWNRNFNNKYTVPIQVINSALKKSAEEVVDTNISKPIISDSLSLRFYPEGGTLLNNTKNIVYVTLQNNDAFLKEQLITVINKATNKKVANIRTNNFGYAVFNLPFHNSIDYVTIVNYKNEIYKKLVPKALDSGIVIHKKRPVNNKTTQDFVIKMSSDLLTKYNKEIFFATIHRNHKLLYVLPFEINKKHGNYVLPIEKDNLFAGYNSITIFNSKNKPIAERHFFNESTNKSSIEIVEKERTKDSITIDLQLKDLFKNYNLSVSVLPTETKLNENAGNIKDAFFLDPYVSNLQNTNIISNVDLDMLLQTQAKKTIKNILNISSPNYPLERGISVSGTVNAKVQKDYKVLLSSKESEILEITPLKTDKSFRFNNLVLKDSSNYKLALLNEKGVIIKSGFYVYKNNESYKPEESLQYNSWELLNLEGSEENVENKKQKAISNYQVYKNAELLDEVVVKGRNQKEEPIEDLYPNTPNELGNGFNEKLQFGEHEKATYTLISFLNTQPGIRANENVMGASVQFDRAKNTTFFGDTSALILIDGQVTNADALAFMSLNEVSTLKVNVSGAGYGMQGSGGILSITLQNGRENKRKIPNVNYFESTVDFGFSSSSSIFKNSQLVFNSMQTREFYETLDWVPNFNLQPNNSNILKIYKGEHENITLFINGMSDDGQLIYKAINIPIHSGL